MNKATVFFKKANLFLLSIFVLIIALIQSCTKPELQNETEPFSTNNTSRTNGIIADGTYKITIPGFGSNAIGLVDQTMDDSVYVKFRHYNPDSTRNLWRLTNIVNDLYRISCAYSGKVLAAPSNENGVRLMQVRYDTSKNQLWRIVSFADTAYKIINAASGLCVNVEVYPGDKGNITQRKSENIQTQFWQFKPVKAIYVDVDAVNFFRRTEGWIASDGAASVAMNDGRVAWFMGDSHIDDYFYNTGKVFCLFQVRNAALLQPASHSWHWPLTTTLIGNPFPGFQSYLKNKPSDDYWMWPGCGFQPDGNDTMYVYNQPLKSTGSGAWSWADDGPPIWAKIRTSDMKVVQYSPLQTTNNINFGAGFVKESDGYIYAYGFKGTFIYANVYIARFPANNPNAAWSFWTGSGWSKNVKDIKRIGESASNGVAVVKYNNKYIIISTEFSVGCDQGTLIYASVSDNPTGPFTWRREFYQIPDRLQGHAPFFYAPNGHPQFQNKANELLITYDINGYGDCVNTCKNGRMDPDLYRPKAIRVPFSFIEGK